MGENETVWEWLDKDDVRGLLSHYVFEIKRITDGWSDRTRSWGNYDELAVREVIKRANKCVKVIEQIEKMEQKKEQDKSYTIRE